MNKIYILIPLAVALGFLMFPFVAYFGNHIMVITSGSMLPTLKINDLIVVEESTIDEIKKGDIIAFDSHEIGIGIVAHRAYEVYDDDGQVVIDTKGDNRALPDPWVVMEQDLVGKVIDIVPSFGILLVEPVRYTLVAVIVITAMSLLWNINSESKKTSTKESND